MREINVATFEPKIPDHLENGFPLQQKKQESQDSISFCCWLTSWCQFFGLFFENLKNSQKSWNCKFWEMCLQVQQKEPKSQEAISFCRWSTSRCWFFDLLAKKLQNRVWHFFGSFRDWGLNDPNQMVFRVRFKPGAFLIRPFDFC